MGNEATQAPPVVWSRGAEFYVVAIGKPVIRALHFSYLSPLLPFKVSFSNIYTYLNFFKLCFQLCNTLNIVTDWNCTLNHLLTSGSSIQWALLVLIVIAPPVAGGPVVYRLSMFHNSFLPHFVSYCSPVSTASFPSPLQKTLLAVKKISVAFNISKPFMYYSGKFFWLCFVSLRQGLTIYHISLCRPDWPQIHGDQLGTGGACLKAQHPGS